MILGPSLLSSPECLTERSWQGGGRAERTPRVWSWLCGANAGDWLFNWGKSDAHQLSLMRPVRKVGVRVWENENAKEGKKERWRGSETCLTISGWLLVTNRSVLCVRMCFQSTSERLMRQKRGSLMISGINHSQYVQLRSKLHVILNFPEKKNDLLINIDYPGQTGGRERDWSRRRMGYLMCSHQSHFNCSLSCGA